MVHDLTALAHTNPFTGNFTGSLEMRKQRLGFKD